ncbi:hypothetical protein C8A00DRAFT_45257 [Chaetomidium leptoderma]|uniref:Amidoligase enzyme-domain-containing protein n=1 Tax=Chaetomidium leptoderma TaxID=669021 RepID=A0AAN6VIM6_9PEZI|nr:hypothetical protein C8A00DRAFT_45257 [Chaetomidium leptoderma]
MAQNSTFRFGVEIELLVDSPKKHRTWGSLATDLSEQLAKKAGIPNRVHESSDYSQWSIVKEITVQDPDGKNPYQYGIELVSPIHTAASLLALKTDLTKIFNLLASAASTFTLTKTHRASSHIHISRTPPLTTSELASLAKATLYFEPALNALMPPSRSGDTWTCSSWAKSNRGPDNPSLAGLTLKACLTKLDNAAAAATLGGDDNTRPLIEIMNLCSPTTSRWGRTHGRRAPFVRGKTYKWDFTGLLLLSSSVIRDDDDDAERGIEGTIEFRQPPGSVSAEEAMGWVTLAVAFVAGAAAGAGGLQGGFRLEGGEGEGGGGVGDSEEGGCLGELWGVLEQGREVLGWDAEDLGVLKGLFRGATV